MVSEVLGCLKMWITCDLSSEAKNYRAERRKGSHGVGPGVAHDEWADLCLLGSQDAVGGKPIVRYRVRIIFHGPGTVQASFERQSCAVREWFDYGFMHWGFWWKRSGRCPEGGVCK